MHWAVYYSCAPLTGCVHVCVFVWVWINVFLNRSPGAQELLVSCYKPLIKPLIVLCVGDSKAPPVLYSTYKTVFEWPVLYGQTARPYPSQYSTALPTIHTKVTLPGFSDKATRVTHTRRLAACRRAVRCVPQRRGYLLFLHGVLAERKH